MGTRQISPSSSRWFEESRYCVLIVKLISWKNLKPSGNLKHLRKFKALRVLGIAGKLVETFENIQVAFEKLAQLEVMRYCHTD